MRPLWWPLTTYQFSRLSSIHPHPVRPSRVRTRRLSTSRTPLISPMTRIWAWLTNPMWPCYRGGHAGLYRHVGAVAGQTTYMGAPANSSRPIFRLLLSTLTTFIIARPCVGGWAWAPYATAPENWVLTNHDSFDTLTWHTKTNRTNTGFAIHLLYNSTAERLPDMDHAPGCASRDLQPPLTRFDARLIQCYCSTSSVLPAPIASARTPSLGTCGRTRDLPHHRSTVFPRGNTVRTSRIVP